VFTEGNSLLMKLGLIMVALALALVITAMVVSATLRSEPERAVAAEVAGKATSKGLRNSSAGEWSATRKPSSKKETHRYPSREESLSYGWSSSGGPVGQRKQEAEEPQSLVQREADRSNSQSPMAQSASQQTPSEVPSVSRPQPQQQRQPHQQQQPLPAAQRRGWSQPTQTGLNRAKGEPHYELLAGAIMGLTIEAIGNYDAPVFDSFGPWALANGVAHHPKTSLPWSRGAQRNVYLAGHRMGYRGTWSRMIFYNLDKLKRGDEVVLKDRSGRSYRYRVREVFITDPKEVWVMGQVRGRDMVTLQICTPYPTFEKRLIVRAERV
jgi:sortase A